MSFGLFSPSGLTIAVKRSVCAIGAYSSRVHEPPTAFKNRIEGLASKDEVRTYDIEVEFEVVGCCEDLSSSSTLLHDDADSKKYNDDDSWTTQIRDGRVVEEEEENKKLSGRIKTYGFCVEGQSDVAAAATQNDNSHHKNAAADHRLDICFCAGDLRPDPGSETEEWAEIFGTAEPPRQRSLSSRLVRFLGRLALGIELEPPEPAGVQRYIVSRPIVGYVDVLYADDEVRVTRGNRGSLVVMHREPAVS